MKRIALLFLLSSLFSHLFAQQRLDIVTVTPRGETVSIDQSQTIAATFNQPMVALQAVPKDEGSGPLVLTPSVRGKYRWAGTTTIRFIPDENLPFATAFRVAIPAGTKSNSGQTLAAEYAWTFETPRPVVEWVSPGSGADHVRIESAIMLRFNQPVDPRTVSAWISIAQTVDGKTTFPAYSSGRRADVKVGGENWVVLTPNEKFKVGAQVRVTCKAGLQGTQGPLGMKSDYVASFATQGRFVFVGLIDAEGMRPNQALHFRFSNPVSHLKLREHIVLSPESKVDAEDWDWEGTDHSFSFPLQPEREYTGKILPGLDDTFGNTLPDTVFFHFRTGSYPASVRMTTGQGILEAYASHKYPVRFMNVKSVTLQMGKVDPDRAIPVMQRLDYSYSEKMMWEQAILDWFSKVPEGGKQFSFSREWSPALTPNKESILPIDLDEVLGTAQRGIVLIQLQTPTRREYQKALIQVTSLGITAKYSPENALVWVTSLKDAAPVEGATVEIRDDSNHVRWTGTTDGGGFAKGPGWARLGMTRTTSNTDDEEWDYQRAPRLWVLVKKGDDVSFSSSDWNDGIEPWIFGVNYVWSPKAKELESTIFTDRGLYKAGEQVEMKGIVRSREEDTWKIPVGTAVNVEVKDSRGEEVLKTTERVNRFGSFALSIPLKESASLGTYNVRAIVGTQTIGWGSFRVEAFKPAEFEVLASFARGAYVMGDTVQGVVTGRYLFGAPMSQAPAQWRLTVSPRSWEPPGYESYWFGPIAWLSSYERWRTANIQSIDTTLDDQGTIAMRRVIEAGSFQGAQTLMLEADVTSPSRQVISGRTSVLLHGAEFTIGVEPSGTFVSTDSTMHLRFVAVNPSGGLTKDVRMTCRILRRIWRSVQRAETGGRYTWESQIEDTAVDSVEIVSGSEPSSRAFVPKEAGFYIVETRAKDARGNSVLSNAYFYVSGPGYVPWERRNDDRIDLITDKKSYKPGETARIIVKSPYEKARAMITIEREGIHHHATKILTGSAPEIRIPITKEYIPNMFVSVVLLQGRVEGAAITRTEDVGRPSFKIGYVELPVAPDLKRLDVKVTTDKKEYRPGDSVTVSIATTVAGKAESAEIALSVADQGVLNLIGYRLPNPFDVFYRPRGLAVTTTESRIHLVQQRSYDEKGEDEGGGGLEARAMEAPAQEEGIRQDFRPSAYWNPSVVTGKNGKATIRFKLPDNLTAFQVMATGGTPGSEFGYGEATIRVNKPLLMQPAFPRFARFGDACEGGVVLTNTTDATAEVRLVTTATGIHFEGKDTLALTVKPGQSKEVRQQFSADALGVATFTFRASTGTDSDALRWKLPVQAPKRREAAAMYETTEEAEAHEKIIPPADAYPDLGGVEVTAASTAMVGLKDGITYLFEYPYGCLEQRLSRVLPMILAKELVEAFKLDVLKGSDYRQVVEKMLGEVPLFQRGNGGFSYWKNTYDTWPYLSAFTMLTLVQARLHGYPVDNQVMDEGFGYLRRVLNGEEKWIFDSDDYDRTTQALIAYAFSLNKTPDYGLMEKLFNEREQLSIFARSYLLRSLKAANGNPAMISELVRNLMNNAKITPVSIHFEEASNPGWYWVFGSNVRTTALTVQALAEAQPDASMLSKAVRWLLEQRRGGCWRTTQENTYVVDALATWFRTFEKDEPNFRAQVRLAGRTVLDETFKGRSTNTARSFIPMKDLTAGATQPVDITKSGAGRLFYGLRLTYYPTTPNNGRNEGIGIQTEIEGAVRQPDGSWSVKAGSLLKITLTVSTNQQLSFVVIDDPLPAGFETVNLSFATTATNLNERTHPEEEWWWENPFRHREMKDDRALFFADYLPAGAHTITYLVRVTSFGTYAMPGTYGEEMYQPEVFGQTKDLVVTVK